ncbi:hypothetical protein EVA_18506 [gut metagenome]|uniref:Uncharacterized protein n=1 Tax=gut metagenome TaxID=749906 RepID=J9FUX9_9ZZZZ
MFAAALLEVDLALPGRYLMTLVSLLAVLSKKGTNTVLNSKPLDLWMVIICTASAKGRLTALSSASISRLRLT